MAEQLERLVFSNAVGISAQQPLDLLVVVVPVPPDGLWLGYGGCGVVSHSRPREMDEQKRVLLGWGYECPLDAERGSDLESHSD